MSQAERTFVTRCALAVRPIDIWTGAPPSGSAIRVQLAESGRKPVRTSDGCYAFLDYTGQACTLTISSSTYLEHRANIQLPASGGEPPVVTVGLLPNSVYSPPAAATGIVFQVRDERDRPLPGARISAYVDDESAVRGWTAGAEDGTLRISPGVGKLLPGDAFVLRERDGTAIEWSFVAESLGGESVLGLLKPLTRQWSRGARLLPAVTTHSDANGMVVIPFRGFMPATCPLTVQIESGGRRMNDVWMAEGGRVVRLPAVRMQAE